MARARSTDAALSAAGEGALGGANAEIDLDDAQGPERAQCFGGGEIEACGLELLLDGTMEQGRAHTKNVSLYALVGGSAGHRHKMAGTRHRGGRARRGGCNFPATADAGSPRRSF
jgi:hypothetical protein